MIKITLKDVFIISLVYTSICLLVYFLQSSLLFFPSKTIAYNTQAWSLLKNGNDIIGLEHIYKNNIVKPIKTYVLFHGNAGNANQRQYYINLLDEIHKDKYLYRLIVVEYPGYGLNYQKTTDKSSLISHAQKTMSFLIQQYSNDIIVIGESLGTGIASQMVMEFKLSKIVLITPYSSINDVASSKFWFLPVSFLLKNNFNSMDYLNQYKGKSLFIIAENDSIIPPKFAEKLYNYTIGNKQKIVVSDADHNDWLAHFSKDHINTMREFLE